MVDDRPLGEELVASLWQQAARINAEDKAVLTAEELLLLLHEENRTEVAIEQLKKEICGKAEGKIGRHSFVVGKDESSVFWLRKGLADVGTSLQIKDETESTARTQPTVPLKRKANDSLSRTPFKTPQKSSLQNVSSPRFTAFKSPIRTPGTPGQSAHATPVKSNLGTPRTRGGSNRGFKSPFKSPFAVRKSSVSQLPSSSDGTSGDPVVDALLDEKRELESKIKSQTERLRKIRLVKSNIESGETDKVDALVEKWRASTREILATLRDAIGPIVIEAPGTSSFGGWSNDGFGGDPPRRSEHNDENGVENEQPQYILPSDSRLPTLQELCASMKLDIAALGDYNEDMDEFRD